MKMVGKTRAVVDAEERVAKAIRDRAEIQAQLDEIDRKSVRSMRANEVVRIDELEAQAVELRSQLAGVTP